MRVSESGGAGTSPLLGRRSGGREGRVTPLNRVTPRHAQEPRKKRRGNPPGHFPRKKNGGGHFNSFTRHVFFTTAFLWWSSGGPRYQLPFRLFFFVCESRMLVTL